MNNETRQQLLSLNYQFYQTFAKQFSATRQHLQPGVLRVIEDAPLNARWLDLGCGNGELARRLAQRGFQGHYLGLDFSPALLEQAAQGLTEANFRFLQVNLADPEWQLEDEASFDLGLAFAVFHHLPGSDLRVLVLKAIHQLLVPKGRLILSNWQFLNSPRLVARIQPWQAVGLDESNLDEGDYLLDWREGGQGLRYVHHFSETELVSLALHSGFKVVESFLSDGKNMRLSLYQVWEKIIFS